LIKKKKRDSGCNAIRVHYFKQGKGVGYVTCAQKQNLICPDEKALFSPQCCVWWGEEEQRQLPLGFNEMLMLPVIK